MEPLRMHHIKYYFHETSQVFVCRYIQDCLQDVVLTAAGGGGGRKRGRGGREGKEEKRRKKKRKV